MPVWATRRNLFTDIFLVYFIGICTDVLILNLNFFDYIFYIIINNNIIFNNIKYH